MEYINIKDENYTIKELEKLKKVIKSGGMVIIPTDTIYGLAADALNPEAIRKIYDLKRRDTSKPMSIVVSNIKMLENVTTHISDLEKKTIEKFLPGAITIILKKSNIIPDIVTSGLDTVGVRMPNHRFLLELIEFIGTPIVATSCNFVGQLPLTDIKEIEKQFKDDVDAIVDDGKSKIGAPSTIIKINNNDIDILREGPIKKEDIIKNIN